MIILGFVMLFMPKQMGSLLISVFSGVIFIMSVSSTAYSIIRHRYWTLWIHIPVVLLSFMAITQPKKILTYLGMMLLIMAGVNMIYKKNQMSSLSSILLFFIGILSLVNYQAGISIITMILGILTIIIGIIVFSLSVGFRSISDQIKENRFHSSHTNHQNIKIVINQHKDHDTEDVAYEEID